jgi:hypothetical protein
MKADPAELEDIARGHQQLVTQLDQAQAPRLPAGTWASQSGTATVHTAVNAMTTGMSARLGQHSKTLARAADRYRETEDDSSKDLRAHEVDFKHAPAGGTHVSTEQADKDNRARLALLIAGASRPRLQELRDVENVLKTPTPT